MIMLIRHLEDCDVTQCLDLVRGNWGDVAAERALEQMYEYFKGGKYAPKFFVARITETARGVAGFAAYHRSMRMHGAFDLIWVAVDEKCQGSGVGNALTEYRIAEITKLGGSVITLVTQKPTYFLRFGFALGASYGNGWVEMVKVLKQSEMG